jgi:hypothetical protein
VIEWYWEWLGAPLSRWVGAFTDQFAFVFSELLLWVGIFSALALLYSPWHDGLGRLRMLWGIGVLSLLIQAFSQGATPYDFVPTVFRSPVEGRYGVQAVDLEGFDAWFAEAQAQLLSLPEGLYMEASMDPALSMVNDALDRVLEDLDYPAGRTVSRSKQMVGLTRLLGLAYGGPAYHDVITGEVVLVKDEDLPSSKAWRWWTTMHEVAHAKGFTGEMDAEVLTFLALGKLDHPLGPYLQAYMALSKSGRSFKWPEVMLMENKAILEKRKSLNQPVVFWMRRMGQKFSIQNSGAKYGALQKSQLPKVDHPFFGVVMKWRSKQI